MTVQSTGEQTQDAVVPLHRNRDFRLLWIGQACSDLGSRMTDLAFPLLVLFLTDSPTQAGLVGTASLLAYACAGVPAGALADRWNRKHLMIACDLIRALAMTILVTAILGGWASVPLIVAIAAVAGVANASFGPAHTGALRNIVPTVHLPRASARIEARGYAAELVGPPLGGALFGVARFAPFLADVMSYVMSFACIAAIRRPLQDHRNPRPEPLLRSIGSGLRFVLAEPFLRATMCVAPLLNATFTGVMFVLVVVLQQQGTSAAGIGGVQSAVLVGGLLGALLAPALLPRVQPPKLIVFFCWLIVGLAAAAAALTTLDAAYAVAVPLALAILLAPTINAAVFGYVIAITPDSMQGRVDSALNTVSTGLSPLAPLAGGLLVEYVGGGWAMLTFAGVLAVAAVIASASKAIRHMRPLSELHEAGQA